jgi:hypothetical protein
MGLLGIHLRIDHSSGMYIDDFAVSDCNDCKLELSIRPKVDVLLQLHMKFYN